jgi:hypothetical protein
VDCEEFKQIRHLHIFFDFGNDSVIRLEKSDYNIKPENPTRKYMKDVFNAFPAVSFTLKYHGECYSSEKMI